MQGKVILETTTYISEGRANMKPLFASDNVEISVGARRQSSEAACVLILADSPAYKDEAHD